MGMLMRRSYSVNQVKEQPKVAPTPVKAEEKVEKTTIKEKLTKKK